MKKILSLALSISLMLSSVSSVWAAGSEDGTQTVPSSYDIRSEGGTPHTESSLSASGLTEEAQGSDFGSGYEGDAFNLYTTESGSKYLLAAAQKVFVLSRNGEITDAEWFSMNEDSSYYGSAESRIKKAVLNEETVLLGDELLILGWDDAYTFESEDISNQESDITVENAGESTSSSDQSESESITSENSSAEESVTQEEADTANSENQADENYSENNSEENESEDLNTISDKSTLDSSASEDNTSDTASDESIESHDEKSQAEISSENTPTETVSTEEDEKSDTTSSDTTGAWLVKNLSNDTVSYISFSDETILLDEVVCLTWSDENKSTYHYASDGGVGDGRLTKDNLDKESLIETLNKANKKVTISDSDTETSPWMAVMYTASHDEKLTDVTFYTDSENCTYDIQVYLYSKKGKPATGNALYTDYLTGTAESTGYHTVSLPESVSLEKGDRFTIAIRFHNEDSSLFYDTSANYYDENGTLIAESTASKDNGVSYIGYGESFTKLENVLSGTWRIGALTDYTDGEETLNTAAASNSALVDGGLYIITSALNHRYVLDVQGGNVTPRTNVQLYTSNQTNAQKWYAHKNDDGTWSFISCLSGRALDVYGNGITAGTNVQIHTARYYAAQRFNLIAADESGQYFIQHDYSGKVLEVKDGVAAKQTNIQLGTKDNSDKQKFIFTRVETEDYSGSYLLTSALSKSYTVASSSGSIVLQKKSYENNQIFKITSAGDGYYYITDSDSGKRITINGKPSCYKTLLSSKASDSNDGQKWRIIKNDDGTYSFFSKESPHICIQLNSSKAEDNVAIRTGSWSKSDNQKFYLADPTKGALDGTFTVRSALYPDRVLDVANGSSSSGANIQSYNSNNTAAQQFTFKKVNMKDAQPVYYIMCNTSGMALGIEGTFSNNANVVQVSYTGADSQKWYVTPNDDGTYTIASYIDGQYALDIASASLSYNANVQIHKSNSTAAQKWYLTSETITGCQLTAAKQVTVYVSGQSMESDDGKVYLVALDPTNYLFSEQKVLGSTANGDSFSITSSNLDMQTYINYEFFTAIKIDGIYHITSNGMYITNPEMAASKAATRTTPINKKGLQAEWSESSINEVINTLHVKNLTLNLPLSALVSGDGPAFNWRGTTYNFSSNIAGYYKNIVHKLNQNGIQVTCVVYAEAELGTNSQYADYITPNGRDAKAKGATLAGMNASEVTGRKKLEALFAYLATTFSDCDAHVDNWVIANEIDNAGTWNYCGDNLSIDYYTTLYTQVYRLAYNTMKSIWSNVRVYTSLDNVWNVDRSSNTYRARLILDNFNSILNGEGSINWSLAFHPYCAPELDARYWLYPEYATSDGATTQRITMGNIDTLVSYCKSKYGSGHNIILSETGINAYYNGKNQAEYQAAAIAYAYYTAEATNGIDNITIHSWRDDSSEVGTGWNLGLKTKSGEKRLAFYVYANMDSKANGYAYTETTKWQNVNGQAIISLISLNGTTYSKWTDFPKLKNLKISNFGDNGY